MLVALLELDGAFLIAPPSFSFLVLALVCVRFRYLFLL